MIFSSYFSAGIILASLSQSTLAAVTLIVPGFDPQPLSAVELGVDSTGHTTWEILPGVATASDDEVDFIGTAILVEGPNDAHLYDPDLPADDSGAAVTLDITCAIANGVADCTGNQGYETTPMPLGTQGPIEVQGAAAAAATPSASVPTASSGSGAAPNSAASVTAGPTASRSGTAAAAGASTTAMIRNGANAVRISAVGVIGIIGSVLAGLLAL